MSHTSDLSRALLAIMASQHNIQKCIGILAQSIPEPNRLEVFRLLSGAMDQDGVALSHIEKVLNNG